MAKKTVFQDITPGAVSSLGITDDVYVGLYTSSKVETVLLTESTDKYNEIKDLIEEETTNKLSSLKKAFILPLCNISQDRLKPALKEHGITVTNDYEKADCIISHYNFYGEAFNSACNIPSTQMMTSITNGYFCNDTDLISEAYFEAEDQNVILDKRSLGDNYTYNMNYFSMTYHSYIITGLAMTLAELIKNKEIEVVSADTVLRSSANLQVLTDELVNDLVSMTNTYNTEDNEIAAKIIPTIDYTKEPALLFDFCKRINNLNHKYRRNKDIMYWKEISGYDVLRDCTVEQAIEYFEEKGLLDSKCFKTLEPLCRKEIQIYNRSMYTFTVQVKPEYRKYLKTKN